MTESNEEFKLVDRRTAMKKAAAAGLAAGVVWTAPKVEGLSMRPNYAAAQSVMGTSATFTANGGPTSAFQSQPTLCGGNASIFFQIRKDDPGNLRNITFTANAFNGQTNFGPVITVTPSDYVTGGIPLGANTFTGTLNGSGPVTVNIPYTCL